MVTFAQFSMKHETKFHFDRCANKDRMGVGSQLIGDAERPFRPFFANTIPKIPRKSARYESLGRGDMMHGANPNARTHVMINALLP